MISRCSENFGHLRWSQFSIVFSWQYIFLGALFFIVFHLSTHYQRSNLFWIKTSTIWNLWMSSNVTGCPQRRRLFFCSTVWCYFWPILASFSLLWLVPGNFIFYQRQCHKMSWFANLLSSNFAQILLQQRWASIIIKWDCFDILQSKATAWDDFFVLQSRQVALQNRACITNWGNFYYKVGQVIQNRAISTTKCSDILVVAWGANKNIKCPFFKIWILPTFLLSAFLKKDLWMTAFTLLIPALVTKFLKRLV